MFEPIFQSSQTISGFRHFGAFDSHKLIKSVINNNVNDLFSDCEFYSQMFTFYSLDKFLPQSDVYDTLKEVIYGKSWNKYYSKRV